MTVATLAAARVQTPYYRWLRPLLAAILAVGCIVGLTWGVPDLSHPARAALLAFALALLAWVVLRWDDTPVAMLACLALVASAAVPPQALYASLGSELIWLLLGSFILSAAVQNSGLAERAALRAIASVGNAASLCRRLCWVVMATAFVIPSTSARAALLLPVFTALAQVLGMPRIVRALALLFPTTILLSAGASLLGAGAHLVAVDFIERSGDAHLGFVQWAWLGLPFTLIASLGATELILRLFLTAPERTAPLRLPPPAQEPLSITQRGVLLVTVLSVAGWVSGPWIGVDTPLVALAGALAATCKPLTGISMAQALKKLEWNLLLFLAATTLMGHALIDTGAAHFLAQATLRTLPLATMHPTGLLATAALLSVLSHLLITSRTARAVVLIPTLALPLAAASGGSTSAALLIFLIVQGSGFCQTLTVSAKPVALFAKCEHTGFTPHDLLRLALVLAPCMVVLLVVFARFIWPLQGLG